MFILSSQLKTYTVNDKNITNPCCDRLYKVTQSVFQGVALERVKLLCGLWDFRVAIGCRGDVKCPVTPPTRLCSRRGTVPETRETKDMSHYWEMSLFKAWTLNFGPWALCCVTDLSLNHPIPLEPHVLHYVTHVNLGTDRRSGRLNQRGLNTVYGCRLYYSF